MLKARDSNAAKEAAAYIASHGEQVNRWVAAAGK